MKRWIGLSLLVAARLASAEPRHVMVLRSEGSADASTRTKIDTQILKLAKSIEGTVEAGDISFADASTAVGCNSADASCKDEVLGMLGVDEIVTVTVTASGGKTDVTVRRIPKTGMPHEAKTSIPSGQPPDAKLNADVGPLFGASPAPSPEPEKPAPPIAPPHPATTEPGPIAPAPDGGAPPTPTEPHVAPPVRTAQVDTVTAAPAGQVTDTPDNHDKRRLEVIGLGVGGGLALIGVVMWLEASSTQNDINSAPVRTTADFRNLQDLESRADTYSALGNVMFIGGAVLGGVAGFMIWRDHRDGHASQQARIAPAVFGHGAGLTLTVGGAP